MQGRHDLEGMMRDGRSSPGSCRYRRRHSAPCRPRRATPLPVPPRAGMRRHPGGVWGVLLPPETRNA